MENDGVNLTADIPDTFLFHFAALVLTLAMPPLRTVQEAIDGAEDEDEDDNRWFDRFLSRNDIAIRVITNKAQQPPAGYCGIILNFFQLASVGGTLNYGTVWKIR